MLVTGFGDSPLLMNFDMLALVREQAVILTQTSTSLVVDTRAINSSSSGLVGGIFTFTGVGVRYDSDNEPIAGTITGVRFTQPDGTISFDLTGISLSAATFYQAIDGAVNRGIPANPPDLLLPGNDEFRGTAGDDIIIERAGHNIFLGGPGSDRITAGDGNDHIYGQSPNGGTDSGDILSGRGGSDYIQGNAGDDDIYGDQGSDRLNGGQGRDKIYGGEGNDTINGNRDGDQLYGDDGNDLIRGGQGDDTINGGEGNDVLMGDRGADQIHGGGGDDIFVFGHGTSEIGSDADDIDRLRDFVFNYDHFSLGFMPEALLFAQNAQDNYPRTVDAARTLAQAQFDQHAGNHEVGFIRYGDFGSLLMFWASDGGATIDSVLGIGGTVNSSSRGTGSFQLVDFI